MCCRAKELIKQLLEVHPEKRLTATQALQHPWCLDKMEGGELTDLSLTRAKLRKKDEQHRFKVCHACSPCQVLRTLQYRIPCADCRAGHARSICSPWQWCVYLR